MQRKPAKDDAAGKSGRKGANDQPGTRRIAVLLLGLAIVVYGAYSMGKMNAGVVVKFVPVPQTAGTAISPMFWSLSIENCTEFVLSWQLPVHHPCNMARF